MPQVQHFLHRLQSVEQAARKTGVDLGIVQPPRNWQLARLPLLLQTGNHF